jgi:hypothetical protein
MKRIGLLAFFVAAIIYPAAASDFTPDESSALRSVALGIFAGPFCAFEVDREAASHFLSLHTSPDTRYDARQLIVAMSLVSEAEKLAMSDMNSHAGDKIWFTHYCYKLMTEYKNSPETYGDGSTVPGLFK